MEEACCDLQVDGNGEETFMVDKRIICKYSGRLRKLFGKSTNTTKNLKVIFHDFPGGAECFELIARFCYNRGIADINGSNISILHCAAHFMEMNNSVSRAHSLLEQTERSIQKISYWTWSELLVALKQCQDLLPDSTSSGIIEKCLESLVGRLALASETSPSPSTSSTDDTRSTESTRNSLCRTSWWFEDLLVLSPTLVQMVIKSMILQKFDHAILSRFLFYYQKFKCCTASATFEEKCTIVETVIGMLYVLDRGSVSCKSLFGTLRAAISFSTSKCTRKKLESMIGSQMDQATLDNLLVPSPFGMKYLYDVNLVLKFVKAFLREGTFKASSKQSRKVGRLMDMYIAEVAPDPCLKPSKFRALVKALPDSSRDSHDEIYRAMDMYLQVHGGLSEEEKMEICCALNYEKLSAETCKHLSQNTKFPSKTALQALMSKQFKLKSSVQDTDKDKAIDQIVLYAGKLDITDDDNEKLKAHMRGVQWRVMELESICRKMQSQIANVMKSSVRNQKSCRSLPKLCS